MIPFNVLKTQGGDGFRFYLAKNSKILKIHDLSETYPFEGATNRAACLILTEGNNSFPVDCKVWIYGKAAGIDQRLELVDVTRITKQFDLKVAPIYNTKLESPWAIVTVKSYKAISKFVGTASYRAYEGVTTALTGLYGVDVHKEHLNKFVIVNNLGGAKRKVAIKPAVVEKSLVYPLIRGRDVSKWHMLPAHYIIVPHDIETAKPLDETQMKKDYPKTLQYFASHKDILANRSIHKLWGRNNPFYSVYDIGKYTFSPFKIVWKDISGKISARGEFGGAAVIEPIKHKFLGKVQIIPDDTLMLIPCQSRNEAHYLAAVLNSTFTRSVVTSLAILHARGYILKYLKINKFDPRDPSHQELSEISKRVHSLSAKNYRDNAAASYKELQEVENDIDAVLAKMYSITSSELQEIRHTISILKARPDEPKVEISSTTSLLRSEWK